MTRTAYDVMTLLLAQHGTWLHMKEIARRTVWATGVVSALLGRYLDAGWLIDCWTKATVHDANFPRICTPWKRNVTA